MRHLTWDNFQATVLVAGQQRSHRASETPLIEFFADGVGNRMGIWLESGANELIPEELKKLSFMTARHFIREGRGLLEIATSRHDLYQEFYHFATAVADRLVVEKLRPVEALALELQCFTDLFSERGILGIERQLGLVGELLFLRLLFGRIGVAAVDAWLGPLGEPHDFRVNKREFEVKTSISVQRRHTINGLDQLVPSDQCELFLVSILLGPPGSSDGFSLSRLVGEMSAALGGAKDRLARFESALDVCGFRHEDAAHYSRCYVMRRPVGLVRVDKTFPMLTRKTVEGALGSLAARIGSVQYEVIVDGLEHEEGTSDFDAAIY